MDEIYLGGTQSSKIRSIASYEYITSTSSWSLFASGLPGTCLGKYYGKMSLGDIDGDGNLDLVAGIHDRWSDSSSNGVEIHTGNGVSTLSLHTKNTGTGSGASVNEVIVADMDGDCNADVVYGARNHGIRVFLGNRRGSHETSFTLTSSTSGLPTSGGDYLQIEWRMSTMALSLI